MSYKRNCISCQKSRGNPKLRARIYHAQFLRENGDETLAQIALDIGVAEPSMRNHAKKHVNLRSVASEEVRVVKNIEKVKAKIQKDTELSFDHDLVIPKQDFEMVVDGVLLEGFDQLKKQGKQISISQLLAAAKIKADYTSKKRGQDTEIIKTMYRMASGGQGDSSGQQTGSSSTGTASQVDSGRPERPGDIHKQTPWDALTPGADTLFTGNST